MGCTRSKIEVLNIDSIHSEPIAQLTKTRSTSSEESNRIVEDCIVVWFLDDSSFDISPEKSKLRHIISTVKFFTDRIQCINYVNQSRIEKIFLIVPEKDALIDGIENLPQIEKTYVLNSMFRNCEKHTGITTTTTTTTTTIDIFYEIDSLCKQLEIDVQLYELDQIIITVSNSLAQTNISDMVRKQEALFLYGQLIREILYRLKFENNAKSEFINFCRLHYSNNDDQLRLIDDFETNYRPQKALRWLTRRCFIGRILQRVQRTFEIDILYKLGFLVKQAHTQLTIFQENNTFMAGQTYTVYRGKTMLKNQFECSIRNNAGGLISFHTFFKAYQDKEISLDFIRRRISKFSESIGILFEISISPAINSARSPFASLENIQVDEKIERNGILFGMSTVFRIDHIETFVDQTSCDVWLIKISLIPDDDPQLLRIVAPLRSSEVHANPISYLGKLFMEMGEYTHAEQFFLQMLHDSSVLSQPRRLVRVHNGLGANYMSKGDFIKALEQYQQALKVSLTYLPPTHPDLSPIYDSIGKSYFHLNNYSAAVENYERAADFIGINAQPINNGLVNDLNVRINSAKKLLNNNE